MGFFDTYKKYEYKKKLQVILPAFVLALGLNTVLFTQVGHELQSSIVSYEGISDSQITVDADAVAGHATISVHEDMPDVSSIHFTLLYDGEAVILDHFVTDLPEAKVLELTQDVPHVIAIQFEEPQSLKANTTVASFEFSSLTIEPRTINVSDTYFLIDEDRYELTNQGSEPF